MGQNSVYDDQPWMSDDTARAVSHSYISANTHHPRGTMNTMTATSQFGGQISNVNGLSPVYATHHHLSNGSSYGRNQLASSFPSGSEHYLTPQYGSLGPYSTNGDVLGRHLLDFPIEGFGPETYQYGQPQPGEYMNASYAGPNSGALQPAVPLPYSATVPTPTNTSLPNTRPHSCPFGCGKSFVRKGDMERHAGVHMPPSFTCRIVGCGKGFYRKDKLKEHLRKHETS